MRDSSAIYLESNKALIRYVHTTSLAKYGHPHTMGVRDPDPYARGWEAFTRMQVTVCILAIAIVQAVPKTLQMFAGNELWQWFKEGTEVTWQNKN